MFAWVLSSSELLNLRASWDPLNFSQLVGSASGMGTLKLVGVIQNNGSLIESCACKLSSLTLTPKWLAPEKYYSTLTGIPKSLVLFLCMLSGVCCYIILSALLFLGKDFGDSKKYIIITIILLPHLLWILS